MTAPLVVLGDALLDVDLTGRAHRLCPDAPVPVLEAVTETARPGGAALAAELAARDGHRVVLVTAVGDDPAGRRLAGLLSPDVELVALPFDGQTPVKTRVRAAGQSLLRLDTGTAGGRVDDPTGELAGRLGPLLAGAGAVLVADYGNGVTAVETVRALLARPGRAPVVWDPHPRGARPVPGVRLVTPNQDEAALLAGREAVDESGLTGLALLQQRARGLVGAWGVHAVAITLGERGALLSYGGPTPALVPGTPVTAGDVCGAGDRFAVTAALALRAGALTSEAVEAAVVSATDFVAAGGAGALAVHHTVGPADRVSGDPPHTTAPVVVATGGCFDLLHAGHVATLRAARALGDRLVVCLNSDASVRRLKGPSRPVVPETDRVRVLEALECVDEVVVFDADTPVDVLRRIRPDVWAKGGDYADTEVPETAVLREWGGQAVVLPYLDGRSTSRLVEQVGAGRGVRSIRSDRPSTRGART